MSPIPEAIGFLKPSGALVDTVLLALVPIDVVAASIPKDFGIDVDVVVCRPHVWTLFLSGLFI
jgi:hypothetical protein